MHTTHTGTFYLLLIFAAFALFRSIDGSTVACRPGEIYDYRYVARTSSFKRKGTAKSEHSKNVMLTRANIRLSCLQRVENGQRDVNVWYLQVDKLFLYQFVGKDEKDPKSYRRLKPKKYEPTTVFAMDVEGRIKKVLSHVSENQAVLGIKKAIIENFQSTTETKCVNRDTGVGTVAICFKRLTDPTSGRFAVKGTATEKDIKKHANQNRKFSSRENSYRAHYEILVNRHGVIEEGMSQIHFGGGENPSTRVEKEYKKLRHGVGFSSKGHADMSSIFSSSTPFSADTNTKFTLKKIYTKKDKEFKILNADVEAKKKQLQKELGGVNKVALFVTTNPEIKFEKLSMSNKYVTKLEAKYKKELRQSFPFWNKLNEFKRSGAKDMNFFTDLFHYMEIAGAPDVLKLYKFCFQNLKDKSVRGHVSFRNHGGLRGDFVRSCQALLIAGDTVNGQHSLLSSMRKSLGLFKHGLSLMLYIRKPIDELPKLLRKVQKKTELEKFLGRKVSEAVAADVRHQSYMALAALARSLPRRKARALLSLYMHHLHKAIKNNNKSQTLMVAHALGNMGDIVPIQLHHMMTTAHDDTEIQKAFVEGLRNHVDSENHALATHVLSHIATSEHLDESVRAAAVLTQVEREKEMEDEHAGSALDHYRLLYHNPNTPASVLSAVEKYLVHDGSERAHEIMTQAIMARENFDPQEYADAQVELFGFVKKAWKSVKKVVTTPFKKIEEVVNKVKNTAKDLKKNFSSATFVGGKVCYRISTKGDNICAYDRSMAQFFLDRQKESDLANRATFAKSFVFEKLFGAKVAHVYMGVGCGVAAGLICGEEDAALTVSAFARAQAYAHLFSNNINLITAHGYVSLSSPPGQYKIETTSTPQKPKKSGKKNKSPAPQGDFLKDNAYIRIYKSVVYNQHIVPDKVRKAVNRCEENEKAIFKKSWNPLFSKKFFFMAGPVPVNINFDVVVTFRVFRVIKFCPARLVAQVGVHPQIDLTMNGYGGISIFIASGGVSVKLSGNYRFTNYFGLFGCKVGGKLGQIIEPFKITVGLYAKALGKRWDYDIYSYKAKAITKTLFERYLQLPIGTRPNNSKGKIENANKYKGNKKGNKKGSKKGSKQGNKKGSKKGSKKGNKSKAPVRDHHRVGRFKYFNVRLDFHAGQQYCVNRGMNLASILNDHEMRQIQTLQRRFHWHGVHGSPWIGFQDLIRERNYGWLSGRRARYTNWAPGEPNNHKNEDCVQVLENGKWNDMNCFTKLPIICEDSRYVYIPHKKNYSQAKRYCSDRKMRLATIRNQADQHLINSMRYTYKWRGFNNSPYIGLTDSRKEGRWLWQTGKPAYFTHWLPGEPNNWSNEDCVQVMEKNGRWNDITCNARLPSICEPVRWH